MVVQQNLSTIFKMEVRAGTDPATTTYQVVIFPVKLSDRGGQSGNPTPVFWIRIRNSCTELIGQNGADGGSSTRDLNLGKVAL